MQKFLLASLVFGAAATLSAAPPQASEVSVAQGSDLIVEAPAFKYRVAPKTKVAGTNGKISLVQADGHKLKQIARPQYNNIINPATGRRAKVKSDAVPAGVLLRESFENPGDDVMWLPEGWTMESKGSAELTDDQKWGSTQQAAMGMALPTDGKWMYGIGFSSLDQDEWLISPEIEIPDGDYQLTYDLYLSPFFFFNLDDEHMNWNEWAFIEQEVISTVQVLVSVDGGEFQVIHDFAQDFMGQTAMEIGYEFEDGFYRQTESLSDYKNKKIKFAFRYYGHDGNSEFLDNVCVSLPPLEGVAMSIPYSTQYYGLSSDAIFNALTSGIATYPVYAPITFMNNTWEDYTYEWHYYGNDSQWATADGNEDLKLEYAPDYKSDFTKRNNLFYPPYLSASAPGYIEGRAEMPNITYLQAGGKPEWAEGESVFEFGMLPFNAHESKVGYYTVEGPDFGERATPLFGHDKNTTKWWTDYTFDGEAEEGDKVELTGILNYIYPAEKSALVVDKIWLHAIGIISDNAEFKVEVFSNSEYYEDGEYMGDVMDEKPIATATLKGSQVLGIGEPDYLSNLCLVFNFETPVVLDNSHPSYMIKITGFNSDEVTWFSPLQQWRPNPDYLCFGWLEKTVTTNGRNRTTLNPVAYYENEYGEMYCAFDINLGAAYPWLTADDTTVELGSLRQAEIAVETYYNGSDLTIESSPWIEATASGRYNECKILVNADQATEAREGFVKVSAPGVETKTFKVTQDVSALSAIEAAGRTVKAVFTPAGTPADLSAPGIYIVTYSDGSVEKTVVK